MIGFVRGVEDVSVRDERGVVGAETETGEEVTEELLSNDLLFL